jgi:hypothetical protein
MRTTAYEIPRLTEAGDHPAGRQSALPVRHILGTLGIPRATFCRWYPASIGGMIKVPFGMSVLGGNGVTSYDQLQLQ